MTYNYAIAISHEITVYKVGSGKILQEPSIVAVQNINNKPKVLCVGSEAEKIENKCPQGVEVVRPIRDGVITNYEYAEYLFGSIVEKLSLKTFSNKNVLLLLSSSLTAQEKNQFVSLMYGVKFNNVAVLPSVLSALTQMECIDVESASMIVNVEDVVDIAVVSNGTILQACTLDIGIDLLNQGIHDYLYSSYNTDISQNICDEMRCRLATLIPNDISDYEVVGNDIDTSLNNTISIQSQELRPLFLDFFNKVCNGIISIMRVCNSEVVTDIKRRGVYLCGSLANISGCEKYIKGRIDIPVYAIEQPEDCVVEGCKILLNHPSLLEKLLQNNK